MAATVVGLLAAATPAALAASQPVYVRPGAPGEPSRQISLSDLYDDPRFTYTEADVAFLQGMIPHHGQALTMSEWARTRAESARILTLAQRIRVVQSGEINRMQAWLERRSEEVPPAQGGEHDPDMPGMLTMAELAELQSLDGHTFDIRFLELMIPHHQGAITMVNRLEDAPGAGLEPTISVLAENIAVDQRAEIRRMTQLLAELREG